MAWVVLLPLVATIDLNKLNLANRYHDDDDRDDDHDHHDYNDDDFGHDVYDIESDDYFDELCCYPIKMMTMMITINVKTMIL